MSEKVSTVIWAAVILVGGFFLFQDDSTSSSPSYSSGYIGRYSEETTYDDYDYEELAYDHWDSVQEYMSGTETIDACSDSGCYSLDADISDGYVETLYFPNGGYIYPDASIDENGYAEGYDYEGNYWEFQIDMDSDLVQDAIFEWASDYADSREDYEYSRY